MPHLGTSGNMQTYDLSHVSPPWQLDVDRHNFLIRSYLRTRLIPNPPWMPFSMIPCTISPLPEMSRNPPYKYFSQLPDQVLPVNTVSASRKHCCAWQPWLWRPRRAHTLCNPIILYLREAHLGHIEWSVTNSMVSDKFNG